MVEDEFFHHQCELDPVRAVLSGATWTGGGALPDYAPEGWAARAELCRATLAETSAGFEPLRERLTAELGYLEAGLASRLNALTAPPMLIREHLTLLSADASVLGEALRAVPAALAGYVRTLREQVSLGRPPARRQAEVVAAATRAWSVGPMFDDLAACGEGLEDAVLATKAGYHEFAEALERDILPASTGEDSVGADAYQVAARFQLGTPLDLAEVYEALTAELDELCARTDTVAKEIDRAAGLVEVCAGLNVDPKWTVSGENALRRWMRERLDGAFAVVESRILDVPEPLRAIEVVVPDLREVSPIRYLPPAVDGARPGRVHWSLPPGEETTAVWSQVSMLHHEGVPGHHLQLGGTVLNTSLSDWRRHTVVAGNAEGWAVYAEGLMAEAGALEEPPARLGYLMALRLNLAVALVDLSLHAGFPLPGNGRSWSANAALEFLAAHSTIPEAVLHFTVLRGAAWPAQALTYAWGARTWQAARAGAERRAGRDFDARHFHAKMLALGPCGLAALADAAAAYRAPAQ
jgi:uncharacterized protein (DUF885 family)